MMNCRSVSRRPVFNAASQAANCLPAGVSGSAVTAWTCSGGEEVGAAERARSPTTDRSESQRRWFSSRLTRPFDWGRPRNCRRRVGIFPPFEGRSSSSRVVLSGGLEAQALAVTDELIELAGDDLLAVLLAFPGKLLQRLDLGLEGFDLAFLAAGARRTTCRGGRSAWPPRPRAEVRTRRSRAAGSGRRSARRARLFGSELPDECRLFVTDLTRERAGGFQRGVRVVEAVGRWLGFGLFQRRDRGGGGARSPGRIVTEESLRDRSFSCARDDATKATTRVKITQRLMYAYFGFMVVSCREVWGGDGNRSRRSGWRGSRGVRVPGPWLLG